MIALSKTFRGDDVGHVRDLFAIVILGAALLVRVPVPQPPSRRALKALSCSPEHAFDVCFMASLANKLAPSIIFIDEIDCCLRTRTGFEHDHVLRVKTEFMTLWDGLLTGKLPATAIVAQCAWVPSDSLGQP